MPIPSVVRSLWYTAAGVAALVAFAPPSGAAPVPSQWPSRGIGGGGAVYCASISPWNGDEVWLTCDMGDMFRSLDFAASWSTIPSDRLFSGKHSAVRFTENPLVLYTLANNGNGSYYPVKSTDGGDHWSPIANPGQSARIFELFADPANQQRLVVSDQFRLYFSSNGGASFGPAFHSDTTAKGLHLAGAYFDGPDVYVATNKGLLVSHDGGASFPPAVQTIAGLNLAQEEIAWFTGARQGTALKFVCTTLAPAAVTPQMVGYAVTNFRNVYAWRPAQAGWSSIKAALPAPATDKVIFAEMVNGDTSTIYLAGQTTVSVMGTHDVHTVFKSTDGGAHFTNVFLDAISAGNNQDIATAWLGAGSLLHNWWAVGQPLGLAIDPHDANRLVVTNSSGPHVSTDGGISWRQGFVEAADANAPGTPVNAAKTYRTTGLETSVCYWLAWTSPTNVLAAFADLLLVRSKDGGTSWSYDYSGFQSGTRVGDLSTIVRQPATGMLYASAGDVVGSAGTWSDGVADPAIFRGYVAQSADDGQTWQVMHDFQRLVSSVALDPTDPARLYATIVNHAGPGVGGGVYVCHDVSLGAASVWDSLPRPARTQGRATSIQVLSHGELVATYTGRTNAANVFVDSSGVFFSSDGGQSWADRTDVGMRQFTHSLTVDPGDATDSTWFACVRNVPTNAAAAGLYRTTDRGRSWAKVFALPALSCTFDPRHPGEMYLCTEFDGLWHATGASGPSPSFAACAGYPFRRPTRVFFSPHDSTQVWVTSEGNGIRLGTIPLTTAVETPGRPHGSVSLACANPIQSGATIVYTLPAPARVSLVIRDVTGRTVARLQDGDAPAGRQQVRWNADGSPCGVYFAQLSAGGRRGTAKLVVAR